MISGDHRGRDVFPDFRKNRVGRESESMTNDFGTVAVTQVNKNNQVPVSECMLVPPFSNMTKLELAHKLLLAEASLNETQKGIPWLRHARSIVKVKNRD